MIHGICATYWALTVSVLQGVASFASSTLSSLYFDVAKDTLYCDPVNGSRRQAIIATQSHVSPKLGQGTSVPLTGHQVLSAMLKMIAPIVPHLAEEVYEGTGSPCRKSSVFLEHWTGSVCRSRQGFYDR